MCMKKEKEKKVVDYSSCLQTVEDRTASKDGQVPPRILNSFTPDASMEIHCMEAHLFL